METVNTAAAEQACVALSYSEPALALELTLALAAHGRERGVDVIWKTNGFMTKAAIELAVSAVAAVNIDLKAADDRLHRGLTGAPLDPVVTCLRELYRQGVWVEVSTPLIPHVSDSADQLARIAELIAGIDPGIPWHLLRFTPAYRRSGDLPTLPARLAKAAALGREAGLRYVYVERALGPAGRATQCPGCGETVVERDIWATTAVRLAGGRCPRCGRVMEGRW